MLARVLALHPEVGAFHEPRPWLLTEAYLRWSGRRDGEFASRKVEEKRDDLIEQVDANGLMYVESSHFLSHLIPDLEERYEPTFVHLYRDGRDFVRSGIERGWYDTRRATLAGAMWLAVLRWIRRWTALSVGQVWEDHRLSPPRELSDRFERIAWLWAEINGEILRHLGQIPSSRRKEVCLEEFDATALEDLLGFLDLQLEEAPMERMIELARRKPNRTEEREVPRPERWSKGWRRRFREIAGPTMRQLGYDAG